jgi:hypothetical protein
LVHPTLRKKREGWGTRQVAALAAPWALVEIEVIAVKGK